MNKIDCVIDKGGEGGKGTCTGFNFRSVKTFPTDGSTNHWAARKKKGSFNQLKAANYFSIISVWKK